MISFLTDILLPPPISAYWMRFLMFMVFMVHLFWVLIMLGGAMIALYYHWITYRTKEPQIEVWSHEMHRIFVLPKAVAVVLGVGAILVTQLYFALPFYTSYVFFAQWWLAVFPTMIIGFLFIEYANHRHKQHPNAAMITDIVGVAFLMAVPAIFVTVLVCTENSNQWLAITNNEYGYSTHLIFHWLARYLHIVGASVIFGAAFYYFTVLKENPAGRKDMLRWIIAGMLIQFVVGGVLAATLQEWLAKWVLIPLTVGITAAVVLVWIIFNRLISGEAHAPRAILLLLPLTLMAMLLTRQYIQQQKVLPLLDKARDTAREYNKLLAPSDDREVMALDEHLDLVYDTGGPIFANACTICHGFNGKGNGSAGQRLIIPPEDINQVRAHEGYLRHYITQGVWGTGMPYFAIYDKYKIDSLMQYLQVNFDILGAPGPLPVEISAADAQEAQRRYDSTCILCHGFDGKGSEYAKSFQPPPPDFTQYNLTPQRTFEVITEGYPGTQMVAFRGLPENVRWGLVQKVNSFFIVQGTSTDGSGK